MSRKAFKFIALPVYWVLLWTSCDFLHESEKEGFCTPNFITEIWILDGGDGRETYLTDGYNPKFSPDGNEIFFISSNQIRRVRLDTRTIAPITPRLEYLVDFQVCRRARTIVYSAGGFSTNSYDIFLWHLDDGNSINLTNTPFSGEWGPGISFDGTRIALADYRYLVTMDLEGNRTVVRKLEPGTSGAVRYNFDSTKLLCMSGFQLNVFDLQDTTKDFVLPTYHETYAVSPVRDEVVILSDGLTLVSLEHQAPVRLADSGTYPAFSDDGQQIVFTTWDKLIMINRYGRMQDVLSTNSNGFESVDISPDGRLFVFSRIRREDTCN
jgi:Tol biopolymer transport system component